MQALCSKKSLLLEQTDLKDLSVHICRTSSSSYPAPNGLSHSTLPPSKARPAWREGLNSLDGWEPRARATDSTSQSQFESNPEKENRYGVIACSFFCGEVRIITADWM